MRSVLVLLNPLADGGRAAALTEPMREWLAEHAPQAGLIESDSIERSRAQVQCLPRHSRIVVAGGDGTLHHLLPVLLTHRLALGVVPLGRANHTARALGLARLAWPGALELALKGPTRRMDLGELHAERFTLPFISGLTAGFDADALSRRLGGPAWLKGRARLMWAMLRRSAALRTHLLNLTIDGAALDAGPVRFASVLNTPSCALGLATRSAARIADGRLDLLQAVDLDPFGALRRLWRSQADRPPGDAASRAHSFESLHIHSDVPLPLVADGEPLSPLRAFEVRIRASAIAVVASRKRSRPMPVGDAAAAQDARGAGDTGPERDGSAP